MEEDIIKTRFEELVKYLKAELGKVELPLEIELLGIDGSPFTNQKLEA